MHLYMPSIFLVQFLLLLFLWCCLGAADRWLHSEHNKKSHQNVSYCDSVLHHKKTDQSPPILNDNYQHPILWKHSEGESNGVIVDEVQSDERWVEANSMLLTILFLLHLQLSDLSSANSTYVHMYIYMWCSVQISSPVAALQLKDAARNRVIFQWLSIKLLCVIVITST